MQNSYTARIYNIYAQIRYIQHEQRIRTKDEICGTLGTTVLKKRELSWFSPSPHFD